MNNNNDLDVPTDTARLIDQRIQELILYTRKTEQEVLEELKFAMLNRNNEWENFSKESSLNFHKFSEANLYCLVKWNTEEKHQKIYNYIDFICKLNKNAKVLDFGGGIGDLTIKLYSANIDVDYLDVPGRTIEFAKWRFKKRYMDIKTYTSLNQVKNYDIIICLDVFEVLEKPLPHLKKFYQLLNPNGILISKLGNVGSISHPMNLEKNREFLNNFDKYSNDIGFTNSNIPEKHELKIKQKLS